MVRAPKGRWRNCRCSRLLAPVALASVAEPALDPALLEAAELIESADPDAMSPREAHELLYRLKAMLKE